MLSTRFSFILAVALCTSHALRTQDAPSNCRKCEHEKYRALVYRTKDKIDASILEADSVIAEFKQKLRNRKQAQATSTATSATQPSPSATQRTSYCTSVMNFFRALCGAANKTRTE